jgi:hypothetical protein
MAASRTGAAGTAGAPDPIITGNAAVGFMPSSLITAHAWRIQPDA